MTKLNFILGPCAALMLAGCTMIPKYERPASPVGTQYPGVTQTNPGNAGDLGWETVFTDERLKQLIRLSLTNNADYQVAVLNVEQSRAQYRITRSASFPSVSASGSYTREGNFTTTTTTTETWSASLGTTAYEVDLFGRVRSQNRQALETFFATAEAQRSAKISLVAEVATEYFVLRQAEEQIALAQATLKSVEDSFALNQANFDAGATSELDLRTAEGQVQTAKINLLTYERARAQAVNYLVLLIGQGVPTNLPAASPFDATNLVAEVSPGMPSELLQRRPDILEAEHTLKAANANIGAARAAFFPTINLTANVGVKSSQLADLFASGTGVWSFAPQITLPIFTGGQNQAGLDSAKISRQIDVVNYQKAIETAFREVADALVAAGSYASQIEAEIKLISAQQRRYELANLRYRQGDDTYLNVLSAQQDLYNAQQDLLQAQFRKLSSQISLYQALGGGWK
ncbi:MAG: efflux transporter outer membrane subunit [Verrucomicrobiae bacterium]|nr:efflux transporter outer membrane subunit [Verrucomicrobiae bacterium]